MDSRHLLLLGAGHAHAEVLRRLARRPEPGLRLTLVTREARSLYSGMLPGVVRHDYARADAEIDCAALAAAAGARLVVGEAEAIDLGARRVAVAGEPPIAYDLLSIAIGGAPAVPDDSGIGVKPIGRFLDRLAALDDACPPGARIAVVGAGAGGAELALALRVRRPDLAIALVAAGPTILPGAPPRARALVGAALARAGVVVHAGHVAEGWAEHGLALHDGTVLGCDAALWVTGVMAPAFLARSGLACDADGCVRVAHTLRSVSHDGVFAAGDCARLEGDARPKAGVWAVRAGAPLTDSVRRASRGLAPQPWRPQREALVILGLGGGRAVGWRGRFVVSGRLVWRCKDWIDRRWMRRFP